MKHLEDLTPNERFLRECAANAKLFAQKNQQYGNSIEKTGVLGACVELIGAVARLPTMVIRNKTHGRSCENKLADVLMDIHNYANIALMMLHSGNWEGKE